MTSTNEPAPSSLLAHAGFVRALARAALRGDAECEDLEQDVWLAAIEGAPAQEDKQRGWLAAVVRNRAIDVLRRRGRRADREQRAARSEAVPGPDEVIARAEEGRRLVAAALALEEPSRTAILLRFLDDLPPRDIAARLGVPVETVRTRVKRGLQALRARLEQDGRQRDRDWRGALAPLLGAGGVGGPGLSTIGAALMVKKLALVAAVALLALAGYLALVDRTVQGPGPRAAGERSDPGDTIKEGPTLSGLHEQQPPGKAIAPAPEVAQVELTGRVVDDRRRGAAGAVVEAHGQLYAHTTTDAEGRFALRAARPSEGSLERVCLVARRGPAEVGVLDEVVFGNSLDSRDVGVLVLGHGVGLAVEVRTEGQPTPAAEVVLLAWDQRSAGQIRARATTDSTGRATLPSVPEGSYRALAFAPGRGRAVAPCSLPREEPGPLLLDLPATRRVDLTLVFEGDEAPLAGAEVEILDPVRGPGWGTSPMAYLPSRPRTTTDAAGRTRLEGLAPDDVLLLAVTGGGVRPPPETGLATQQHPRVQAGVTEARVMVPRPRRIRWSVTDAEGPPPAEGDAVQLRQDPRGSVTSLPATARMEAGQLVAEGVGPGHVHAFAVAKDGRIARLFAKDMEQAGNPTSFRSSRRIEVVVHQDDGSAPTGLVIMVHSQGGGGPIAPPLTLDAEGRATVEGLHGGHVEVRLASGVEDWGGQVIGTVNLDAGDGKVVATVPRLRRGLVRVKLDGQAWLPAEYYLGNVQDIEEDPDAGEIRFRWRPRAAGTGGHVLLVAIGYLRADGQTGPGGSYPFDALTGVGPEPDVVEIELVRGAKLLARVAPPPDGRAGLGLERWDEPSRAWTAHLLPGGRPPALLAAGGVQRFSPVPPGRYRVVETSTGVASLPVDVTRGAVPEELSLDLRHLGWASGRVEVPAGYSFESVRVRVEGLPATRLNPATTPQGAGVSPDGTFSVRVPANVPLTFVVVHPTLAPASESGRLTVRELRSDLVLRLVEGMTTRLRIDPAPTSQPSEHEPCRVLLFRDRVEGKPTHELQGKVEGAVLTFGGYAPGTYLLWIDLPPHAPLLIGPHHLGAGVTDLGTATFQAGASLQVRVLVPEGQSPPRIMVSASHEDVPRYVRQFNSRGEALVTLRGLAPGSHRLVVYPVTGREPGKELNETLEIEGQETLERTLDLR